MLLDVDDTAYLAVTLEDDPAAGLQSAHGRFRYFAPDEVEPDAGDAGDAGHPAAGETAPGGGPR